MFCDAIKESYHIDSRKPNSHTSTENIIKKVKNLMCECGIKIKDLELYLDK
jgi:hypothetical protein